ncbi:MAG: cytochrome P450 [Planctomycetes bacterium]|nr:cytochrome P450 [Planctomycetota bacterium]
MSQLAKLPPGPSGRLWPTLQLMRDPKGTFERWRAKYGDPFFLHALNGPILLTGREDLIREIYSVPPEHFGVFAEPVIRGILGSGSIFAMADSNHKRERRLLMPMFHGERMRSYGHTMQRVARNALEPHLKSGQVEILPLMTKISFQVIVENIFGGSSPAQVEALIDASVQMVRSMHPILFFTTKSHRKFFGFGPWEKMLKARAKLFQLIDDIIDAQRKSPGTHDDILALLCRSTYDDGTPISTEHIRDELITFLFAGHETTALSLTWAMYFLHRSPNILEELKSELRNTGEDPHELATAPFLKACIQETLRLNPIVTETLRTLAQPLDLGEFHLPAGHTLALATILAHYNPDNYPEPTKFDPDRFLQRSYSPFVYMPFGGGHRRCLGAAFATYEMAMVLGVFLSEFHFKLLDSREVRSVRRNVTMGPSSPVPMSVCRV